MNRLLFILLFLISCTPYQSGLENATWKTIVDEPYFFEGPSFDHQNNQFYFTGYRNKEEFIYTLAVDGKIKKVEETSGIGGTFMRGSYLYACDGKGHQLCRFDLGAAGLSNKKVLCKDSAWHQPNDLWVASNGDIFFTDPDFKNKKTGGVYCYSPDKGVSKLLSHLPCPNGIALTKDEKSVIVSDSHLGKWYIYDIDERGQLVNEKIFFNPDVSTKGNPDGMSRDEKGNFYLTGKGFVWHVSQRGKVLGKLAIPEFCSNVFYSYENQMIYVTCNKKIYGISLLSGK